MSTEAKRRETPICIRCTERDALEYPAGHGGQLCGGCEDLQDREYAQWQDEQRAKAAAAAAEGRSYFIDKRRGFWVLPYADAAAGSEIPFKADLKHRFASAHTAPELIVVTFDLGMRLLPVLLWAPSLS